MVGNDQLHALWNAVSRELRAPELRLRYCFILLYMLYLYMLYMLYMLYICYIYICYICYIYYIAIYAIFIRNIECISPLESARKSPDQLREGSSFFISLLPLTVLFELETQPHVAPNWITLRQRKLCQRELLSAFSSTLTLFSTQSPPLLCFYHTSSTFFYVILMTIKTLLHHHNNKTLFRGVAVS